MGQLELSHVASGNVKWYFFENSLAVSRKVKDTPPRYAFQRNESICLYQYLYINVHVSFKTKTGNNAILY